MRLRSSGQVYLANLLLGHSSPTWPWGAGLPIDRFLTAYLYLEHLHGTGRCSTEIIGNWCSSEATAGGQMLCPTVLKMLWGQLNPMPHAFIGLSATLHTSSAFLCLFHLPVARLDLVCGPSMQQRAWSSSHSSDNSHKVSASSTANSVSVSCNHCICLCVRVHGAAPLLASKKSNSNKIFSSSVIPLALTFVPLLPAKCPVFSSI